MHFTKNQPPWSLKLPQRAVIKKKIWNTIYLGMRNISWVRGIAERMIVSRNDSEKSGRVGASVYISHAYTYHIHLKYYLTNIASNFKKMIWVMSIMCIVWVSECVASTLLCLSNSAGERKMTPLLYSKQIINSVSIKCNKRLNISDQNNKKEFCGLTNLFNNGCYLCTQQCYFKIMCTIHDS